MDLPLHLQQTLNIASPCSEEQLTDAAEACSLIASEFGLSGAEFVAAVREAITSAETIRVSRPTRVSRIAWKVLALSSNASPEGWMVTTPSGGVRPPPTEVGKALVKAWISDASIVRGEEIDAGMLVLGSSPSAALSDFWQRLALEWSDACFLLDGAAVLPSWVDRTSLNVDFNSRVRDGVRSFQKLFLEAVSEHKVKWRFLSLYRLFEHGYLVEIFQNLESTFFLSPKQSLSNASKLVENEIQQFVNLVDNAALQAHFETYFDVFDAQKGAGNRLAIAIEASIQQNKQQQMVQGKWQMGVLYCYKIRCSIVHAGLSAPIFDAYNDGPALVDALFPVMESAVLDFLGLTFA